MEFTALAKAALDLGVIPSLALFLIFALHLQNRQLIKQQQVLLEKLLDVAFEQKSRKPSKAGS